MHKFELNNLSVITKEGVAEKTVVEGISLTVKSGEIHVLMGPNGSGKSSFVNALFGHPAHRVAAGAMLLDGEDITALPTEKKARLGLFLSMQHAPEIRGVTMLAFLHRAQREMAGDKGGETSVFDFANELEEKMEAFGIPKSLLSREVMGGFSGGEKKQAEAAQLLALKPRFAFLDEIDSGVDVDSLSKVFAAIRALAREGTGFLLITHYPALLKKITPDFVHVMKGGKIVKSGGHELAREVEEKGFGA